MICPFEYKVGCFSPMVVISILPQAEFGRNDHREDAPDFIFIIFRKRNLEREQDEIKKENTQRKQEIQTLKEVIELKKNEAEREKKYLKEALEEQEELKNQLSSDEFNLPQTLEKDIDKLKRQNDNQKRAKVGFQNKAL